MAEGKAEQMALLRKLTEQCFSALCVLVSGLESLCNSFLCSPSLCGNFLFCLFFLFLHCTLVLEKNVYSPLLTVVFCACWLCHVCPGLDRSYFGHAVGIKKTLSLEIFCFLVWELVIWVCSFWENLLSCILTVCVLYVYYTSIKI